MKNNNRAGLMATASVLIVGLILSGCGQKTTKAPQTPEVAVVTIQPKQVAITTDLTGRTSANLVAEVRPQVGGIIQKRLFTEGSDVRPVRYSFRSILPFIRRRLPDPRPISRPSS
jgi:membrane fusion protein (multidrug efflux system)